MTKPALIINVWMRVPLMAFVEVTLNVVLLITHLCVIVSRVIQAIHRSNVMLIVNIYLHVRKMHKKNPLKQFSLIIHSFHKITKKIAKPIQDPIDPCVPSPCGPYSNCRVIDTRPVCSCQANYYGAPPYCRPECTINSECAMDRACINQKCVDPCPGSCGYNARCRVINHSPICTCNPGYTGNPFEHCSLGSVSYTFAIWNDFDVRLYKLTF